MSSELIRWRDLRGSITPDKANNIQYIKLAPVNDKWFLIVQNVSPRYNSMINNAGMKLRLCRHSLFN